MNINLRPLEEKDLDAIVELEQTSFHKDVWETKETYLKRIVTFASGNIGFFLEQKLVGFMCTELWLKQEEYPLERFNLSHDITQYYNEEGKELYISSFALNPTYKHILRGKEAFKIALAFYKENLSFDSIILMVSEEWKAAINIYLKFNFKEITRIKNYFPNNSDALIMRTNRV